jgi:hypothetical protein
MSQPDPFNFMPTVEVFDANVRLADGRDSISVCSTATQLLEEMDTRGVSRALTHHTYAQTLAPEPGQQMLERALENQERLVGQPCVLPTDASLRLLEELESRHRLRSVRLSYDARQKLLFTPDFYGAICGFLQELSIPLFIVAESIDLAQLPLMTRQFPRLPIVLVEAHYTLYLWIKPLMRGCKR